MGRKEVKAIVFDYGNVRTEPKGRELLDEVRSDLGSGWSENVKDAAAAEMEAMPNDSLKRMPPELGGLHSVPVNGFTAPVCAGASPV